ncbi:MAG: DUF167 domain-containing protein [Ignavibacteriae bacterium]|nr:DUF167 domain-containing protein [Ignavibacteriota bacterium]
MKITVKVKPNARKNEVKESEGNRFVVSVTVPPVDGRANEKVIELLSDFFHKPKRAIRVISGISSRMKILEVD